jgi:hypothetical protein
MKSFDIEEKIICQSYDSEEFMFLLMDDLESHVSEKISRLLCFGDEKSVYVSFLEKFFDLRSPPFIIKKRVFRVDIDIDSPIARDFF